MSPLKLAVKNVTGPEDQWPLARQWVDTVPTVEKREKLLKKSVRGAEKTLSDFAKVTRRKKWAQDDMLTVAALVAATKLTLITV